LLYFAGNSSEGMGIDIQQINDLNALYSKI
jgi:hypothetical protein